jgi:hypothetical protein
LILLDPKLAHHCALEGGADAAMAGSIARAAANVGGAARCISGFLFRDAPD